MTVSLQRDPEAELAQFVASRKHSVLERAITSINDAAIGDLGDISHRLIGTLGTYGVLEVAEPLRAMSVLCQSDPLDIEEIKKIRVVIVESLHNALNQC